VDAQAGSDDAEDVVVVRFEGLGAFALPVADLESYRLPVRVAPSEDPASQPADAIPVILGEDFLRGLTTDRTRLVVDRFGGISRVDQQPIFDLGSDTISGEGGTPPFPD
jgi:hypothetical protein